MWTASLIFWGVVVFLAFKPRPVRVPAMQDVEIVRRRRRGMPVTASIVSVEVNAPQTALPTRPQRPALTGRPVRLALPRGATPMPGTVAARSMPPHHGVSG
ncbi:MAG: hypothetical protein C7B46_19375 [Sulfobacillus benefaciens]|uniref:Uncharacterized protein n=1 Tax=Sulfobacillus benefaciens TaxID=453960 RepID=A0A2T2WZA4_9FIRM|nr:MAG: hypothetical protein C7B46_19375 [Sulfobacillus benefaciens]